MSQTRRGGAVFGAVVVSALAGLGALGGAPDAARAQPAGEGEAPIARVGREVIDARDVVAFGYARYRAEWIRTMENLIDERIVAHEVRRLGLSLPPGRLEDALAREVAARERQLRETYGEGVDLATEVRRGYGLDLETWKRDVLRPRLRMHLLLRRVVRLDTRRRDRVKARVIVLPDEAAARRVLEKLGAGADFSLTALQESADPTAGSGGDLPAIARGDLTLSGVEERLFSASAGQVVGPLTVTLEGRTSYHLYKVIRRIDAWSGTRAELLARLERDLVDHPIERPELERWRARMRRDFGVQVFDPQGRAVTLPSAGR